LRERRRRELCLAEEEPMTRMIPDITATDGARIVDRDHRRGRIMPLCPICGARSKVIMATSYLVEGGAVVRTRMCSGREAHLFQTREAPISTMTTLTDDVR